MISIIFPVRAQNNPHCNIGRFLKSLLDTTTEKEREKVEILLKFDSCDKLIKEIFPHSTENTIRSNVWKNIIFSSITYPRCTGRSDIDKVLSYLGTLVNENSKLIFNIADDFIFYRSGWVTDLLEEYNKASNEYIIFDSCAIEYNFEDNPGSFKENITDYRDVIDGKKSFRSSTMEQYNISYAPIFSTKLFKVISCQCWQPSIDNYFILLAAALLINYDIDIWNSDIKNFYKRSQDPGIFPNEVRNEQPGGNGHNLNEISGRYQIIRNLKYFSLVEQQAKNLYLNIKVEL